AGHVGGRSKADSPTGPPAEPGLWSKTFDVVDDPKDARRSAEAPARSARHPLVTGTGHHARMPGTAAERPILVVDDDEKILRLVRMYLEREGYTVREARDGQAALAAIALYEPALVVLDLMLPEIDGLSVLRAIRRKARTPV